ncbi:MAG TPA: Ig-like domain-containing protein, partial [Verrucomicrobiae bacterium]
LPKINTNGTLTYALVPNACGTSIVTVALRDLGDENWFGTNRSLLSTFQIGIACGTNACPVAANLSLAAPLNTAIDFQLRASDGEGEPLEYRITQAAQHGTVVYSQLTGTGRYTPTNSFCGATDSFKFNVTDGHCVSAEATVTIRTTCCPVASNLTVTIHAGGGYFISALPGSYSGGGSLTYRLTREPVYGFAILGQQGIPTPPGGLSPNELLYSAQGNFVGTEIIKFRISDGVCESEEGTVTIYLVDTTVPQIICPAGDITTEFNGTTGAVVNFLVSATDLTAVSVICTPPSGSTFPIGATAVHCLAADTSGNSNVCEFIVRVLGARSVREKILSEILPYRESVTETTNRARLEKVIRDLTVANGSSSWLSETQLARNGGAQVFNLDERIVKTLRVIMEDDRDFVPDDVLMDWIARLVKTDRLLAAVSVDAAEAAGTEPRKIAEYRESILKADAAVAAGRVGMAIVRYSQVWKAAVRL